jgi:hypothetical protein
MGCSKFFKNTTFDDYHENLKKIDFDLKNNLDIVSVIRRLKFHGFAINFLMNKNSKKLTKTLTKLTKHKPIQYVDMDMIRFLPENIDGLSLQEKLRLQLNLKILDKEK